MKLHSNRLTQQWDTHKDRHHSGRPEYSETHGQQRLVWPSKIPCVSVITTACENLFCCSLDLSLSALRIFFFSYYRRLRMIRVECLREMTCKSLVGKDFKDMKLSLLIFTLVFPFLHQWQLLLRPKRAPKLPVMIPDVRHCCSHFFGKQRLKNISSNNKFCLAARQQNVMHEKEASHPCQKMLMMHALAVLRRRHWTDVCSLKKDGWWFLRAYYIFLDYDVLLVFVLWKH